MGYPSNTTPWLSTAANRQLLLAVVAAVSFSGLAAFVATGGLSLSRPVRYLECSSDKDIQYIAQSGDEYIIVNPAMEWSRNSFLVSKHTSVPKNWLFYGMTTKSASSQGFTLQAPERKPYINSIEFKSSNNELTVNYGENSLKLWKTLCRPAPDGTTIIKAANNVPVEYLLQRSTGLSILAPSLGSKEFNLSLYEAIKLKKNSTYSVYQLLSGIQPSLMTGNQNLEMQDARRQLIADNSSTVNVWEYDNKYTYWWEFANEKSEAEMHGGNWCREQQYSTTADYTSQGYKIVSSSPQQNDSGWIRHDYPDGRFSGYVKFRVSCNGTNYALRKEGSVDADSGNNRGPGD